MTIRVAAAQIDPTIGEVDRNLDRIATAVADAAAAGARLVVLPEAAMTGYAFDSLDEALPVARHATVVGPGRLAALAAEHGLAILCGTLDAEGDEVYNAAHLVTPDGGHLVYRKMHLPYLGIDRFATAGPEPPLVVEVEGMRVGVLICYDLRFPEAARVCALEGADLICLPTNWPIGVDFHPDLFAPARANENHCYLLAADRVGTERGTTFMGRSVFVDPDGVRVGVASDSDEELLVGEVDVEVARATHVRRRPGEHEWDTIADRRPGLYARLLEPGIDRLAPPVPGILTDTEE
jgi:predicted amidohydrolase